MASTMHTEGDTHPTMTAQHNATTWMYNATMCKHLAPQLTASGLMNMVTSSVEYDF